MTLPNSLTLMQPSPGGGAMPLTGVLFQIAMFVVIFWFFLIRPQQKQRKQQEAMLMALRKGDDIVTSGGLVAQVVHIQQRMVEGIAQPSLDDQITIKSGESKLVVERGKIARVSTKGAEPAAGA